jgi:hypothetical protein
MLIQSPAVWNVSRHVFKEISARAINLLLPNRKGFPSSRQLHASSWILYCYKYINFIVIISKNGISIPFRASTDSSQPHNLITCFYPIHFVINMRPAFHPCPFPWGASIKIKTVKNTFFYWDLTPYRLIEALRRCVQKHCLQLLGRSVSEIKQGINQQAAFLVSSSTLIRRVMTRSSQTWMTSTSAVWNPS